MLQDEQFIQFPKWLMQDSEFSKMSSDAKLLYTVLKDRFKLSAKNHWIDKEGRVFVVCKRESMGKLIQRSKNTVTTVVNELIKYKLIEEKHNGLNKPNYIYLLMPEFNNADNLEFDEDNYVETDEKQEKNIKKADKQRTPKNWDSRLPKFGNQESQKLSPNKNNSSNNKSSKDILNNNINNTYTSKPFVVEKELDEYVKNILYKSNSFTGYLESGDLKPFINATERLMKIIKNQSKKRRNTICCFSKSQILKLLEAALEAENNILDTFNNPDGYIVSKINSEIEAIT